MRWTAPEQQTQFGGRSIRGRRARAAFDAAAERHGIRPRVYYAGKAFLSTEVVRWVVDEGLAVDVCTRGELEVALAGGADPARLGFHGDNKSVSELERAVEVGIGSVVVDSPVEIERPSAGAPHGRRHVCQVQRGMSPAGFSRTAASPVPDRSPSPPPTEHAHV